MKYAKRAILFIFAILIFGGALALDAFAQSRRGVFISRGTQRPVIVRRVVRPGFGFRAWRSPYYRGFYDPFYDPYYYSPYLRYQDQKFYMEQRLRGNQRELAKHQAKYRADGIITAKERRELEDDIKDVQKARARLNRFVRNY